MELKLDLVYHSSRQKLSKKIGFPQRIYDYLYLVLFIKTNNYVDSKG